jgi:hypothetical protein
MCAHKFDRGGLWRTGGSHIVFVWQARRTGRVERAGTSFIHKPGGVSACVYSHDKAGRARRETSRGTPTRGPLPIQPPLFYVMTTLAYTIPGLTLDQGTPTNTISRCFL